MRLLAVIAFLVSSILAGAAGSALAVAQSPVPVQSATPSPGGCAAVSATTGTEWALTVTGAELLGVDAGGPPECWSIPAGGGSPSHEHSGWFLLVVESGSITVTVEEGIIWAHCTPDCATGKPLGSGDQETLLPGAEVTLTPGDWILQDRATTHALWNESPAGRAVYMTAFGATPLNGGGGCWGAC